MLFPINNRGSSRMRECRSVARYSPAKANPLELLARPMESPDQSVWSGSGQLKISLKKEVL